SMVDPASAGRTLRRDVAPNELTEAILLDHRRDWGIHIPVTVEGDDSERDARFLDVVPCPGHYVNGAVLRVTEPELRSLQVREAQYDLVEVTGAIALLDPGADRSLSVFTFIAKPEFRQPRAWVRVGIPRRYVDLVDNAITARGQRFAEQFW